MAIATMLGLGAGPAGAGGSGAGSMWIGSETGGTVQGFTPGTTTSVFSFFPYGAGFAGSVRVASGDVSGDGVTRDLIVAPGPDATQGSTIRVYDGLTFGLIDSFSAYSPGFAGGVYVAAGDINGDGHADIVTGAGGGSGPHVKVFSGKDLSLLFSFFAYDASFTGGVRVACADVSGDGVPDIVTGSGPGAAAHIEVFNGVDGSLIDSFFAFDLSFLGGVFVAAGDIDNDGFADIIVGASSTVPHVKVFSGRDMSTIRSFFAFDAAFAGGVRVASGDVTGDGVEDVLAGAGTGSGACKAFDGLNGSTVLNFLPFGVNYADGIYVAGLPALPPPPPTPTPFPSGRAAGDFNRSGCTDLDDFLFLLDFWQTPYEGGTLVGIDDFLALLDNWQSGPLCA